MNAGYTFDAAMADAKTFDIAMEEIFGVKFETYADFNLEKLCTRRPDGRKVTKKQLRIGEAIARAIYLTRETKP